MAELQTTEGLTAFSGRYTCTFDGLVTGEATPVSITVVVTPQPALKEVVAESLRVVCEEYGATEHRMADYAAHLAQLVGAAVDRPAQCQATADLDTAVEVRAIVNL